MRMHKSDADKGLFYRYVFRCGALPLAQHITDVGIQERIVLFLNMKGYVDITVSTESVDNSV